MKNEPGARESSEVEFLDHAHAVVQPQVAIADDGVEPIAGGDRAAGDAAGAAAVAAAEVVDGPHAGAVKAGFGFGGDLAADQAGKGGERGVFFAIDDVVERPGQDRRAVRRLRESLGSRRRGRSSRLRRPIAGTDRTTSRR